MGRKNACMTRDSWAGFHTRWRGLESCLLILMVPDP